MGYQVELIDRERLLLVDLHGLVSIHDRMAMLDEVLFHVREHHPRLCILDLSMMSQANREIEELVFADLVAGHAFWLRSLRFAIIHAADFTPTIILAAFMRREGLRVSEFHLRSPATTGRH